MNSLKVALIALVLVGCAGNNVKKPFTCAVDSQCSVGGVLGKCIAGKCAVPSAQCSSGYVYDSSAGTLAGMCLPGKQALKATCSTADDCLSGFCADGVCCDADCSGSCHSCNAPGTEGHCVNTALNQADPKKACVDDGTPCGHNGLCDGNGGCLFAPPTKTCGTAGCVNGVMSEAALCSGSGACLASVTHVCDPYVCKADGSECETTCTDAAQCKSPNTCTGNSCGKLANGAKCSDATTCLSGNCVDGTCCGSPGCPACNRCDVNGNGTCAPAIAKSVDNRCPAQDASTCGMSNLCDGSGHCMAWPDGTQCSNFGCEENTSPTSSVWVQETGVCQGGACSKPDPKCGGYLCLAPYQQFTWRCMPYCQCGVQPPVMACAPGYSCQMCSTDGNYRGKCL